MKQALTKRPPNEGKTTLRFMPPKVDVRVDAPNVTVDSREFAQAIHTMSQTIAALGANQSALVAAVADNSRRLTEALQALKALQQSPTKPAAAPRPRAFSVEFEKEDGETVGLRIVPDMGH